ncbi:hypothetical protein [Streptomyces hokutonensis]|uniref:hypothetical protein n=1 Tax=Streptomyces hokutonensis TaxID=1306990 RepID=UPI0036963641
MHRVVDEGDRLRRRPWTKAAVLVPEAAATRAGPAVDVVAGPSGGADGVGVVGWDGWAVPALLVLGFGGPEPVVGRLSLEGALDFLGRYAFTRADGRAAPAA